MNSGTSTNWPSDVPAMARLTAVPRPRSNQWLTMAPKIGAEVPPRPAAEMTP